jgi:hypothetical protein
LLQAAWIQGGLLVVIVLNLATFWFLKARSMLATANMRRFRNYLAFMLAMGWLYNEALLNRPFVMIAGFMITWVGVGGLDRKSVEENTPPTHAPVPAEAR